VSSMAKSDCCMDAAIPPVTIDLVSAWFKTTVAREKLCRLLQNATQLLAVSMQGKENIATALAVKASMSATRKVLRFWNPVDCFRDSVKALASKQPTIPKLLSFGGSGACMLTFVCDHMDYFVKMGIRKKTNSTPAWGWWSDFWWLIDASCGTLLSLYKIYVASLLLASKQAMLCLSNKTAEEIFNAADKNNDGVLTKTELKKFSQQDVTLRQLFDVHNHGWAKMWQDIDTDGDGKFTKEEFSVAYNAVIKQLRDETGSQGFNQLNMYVDLFRNLFDIPCALACISWLNMHAPERAARVAAYGTFTSLCGIWQSYYKVVRSVR